MITSLLALIHRNNNRAKYYENLIYIAVLENIAFEDMNHYAETVG